MEVQQRILIIDDEVGLAANLKDIIEEQGYLVDVAYDGAGGLALCRDKTFDVALIDIKLPDMSGHEVAENMAVLSPQMECILITGYASLEGAIEAVKQKRVAAYEIKPLNMNHILSLVKEIVSRKGVEKALIASERRYREMSELLPDAIYEMDTSFKITYANRATFQMFGYTEQDISAGLYLTDIIAPKDLEWAIQRLGRRAQWESPATTEYTLHRKDGSSLTCEGTSSVIRDDDGMIVGYRGVVRDITERKQAEEERAYLMARIQEQAQRVQQIMDTVPEGILLLDAGGRVIHSNSVAQKYLFVLADAQVGNTLTHLGDRPLAELLTSPPRGLWHEACTDGTPSRIFEVIARPIETGPGIEGWVLSIRDVTQEREIQQRAQQQERLASVGQLAAGIAHDFNNIMATIVLYAQMLSRVDGLSLRDRERLATINQQAQHATKLTQQILDFGRHAVMERRPLDMLLFLKEQVKLLKRTLPENIEIGLVYGPDEHTVNADPTRIQQMLMNLAINARDAMPEGGSLHIGLERVRTLPPSIQPIRGEKALPADQEEWVQITVSDTGIGITPDLLPHIFEPFFTTKAPGAGSGLGLAQVHGIVKQHEGEIYVQSPSTTLRKDQEGQGTTFTIYLPALPVHPPESPSLELPALVEGQGETILVVEDDVAARQALVDSLELLNYRTIAAADGREALELLEQAYSQAEMIALVLSDVVMPGMGGIPLLQALRQRGLTTPLVLLSGHPMEKEMGDLQAHGLTDWLLKPPSLEQLAQAVAQAIKGKKTLSK
ncbi:MAG: response regulator [Chloroflexota bacterium]|nr:response regulator [Chloroflexota bacterium]